MKGAVRKLLEQHGFEVLNEERSSFVTRKDGVTYRIWPHSAWTMNMEAWYVQASKKTYSTERWIMLCAILGTKDWFAVYSDKRPTEIWRKLQVNNKGKGE